MSPRNNQSILPQHHLCLYTIPQDFDVVLQHGTVDLELEVHQEAEANFQPREIEIAQPSNLGESTMRIAKVLQCLCCYSQGGQH